MNKKLSYLIGVLILVTSACSKSKKDDDNPGGGGGAVKVSGVSPEYVAWGDNVTITGSGFSTVKTDNFVWFHGDGNCGSNYDDSTGWRKAEVVSASATQLVVKYPYTTQLDIPCGHSYANVHVIVNGKMGMTDKTVKGIGFPVPVGFCGWYGGGFHAIGAIYTGDSVLLEYAGFGTSNITASGNASKIRLKVDGQSVPVAIRPKVSGCDSRSVTFWLDPKKFGEVKCDPKDAFWGGHGKKRNFTFYLDGQPQSEVTKAYWVYSLPKAQYGGATGPTTVSKAVGGNPQWTITGSKMTYNKVRFTAQSPCTGTFEAETTCTNEFCDQFVFGIPLSLLTADCTYTVALIDICGATKGIGSVKINP